MSINLALKLSEIPRDHLFWPNGSINRDGYMKLIRLVEDRNLPLGAIVPC